MENEILSALEQIKFLLVIILIIVTALLLGQIGKFISRLVIKRTLYRENAFIHLASNNYEKKEFESYFKNFNLSEKPQQNHYDHSYYQYDLNYFRNFTKLLIFPVLFFPKTSHCLIETNKYGDLQWTTSPKTLGQFS